MHEPQTRRARGIHEERGSRPRGVGRGTWGPPRAHLELDGEFVGAECEAGGEEHGALLLGHRLGALPLTPLDFLQKLGMG